MTQSGREKRANCREGKSEMMETGMGLTQKGEIQRQRNREEGSGTGTEGGVKDK